MDIVTGVIDMFAVVVGGFELESNAEPAVIVIPEAAAGGAVYRPVGLIRPSVDGLTCQ
jgi:hypothetical protein